MASSNPEPLVVRSQYGDLYDEIVRPDRKYTISHYLRTRWGPLLGPARLWLIVALRQRCFWNDKQDWCVVDKETLAAEAGLSLRSVNRIVDQEDEQPDYTAWFFTKVRRRRYSQHAGRTVNAPNRYQVLLDDPLTPDDQAALAHYMRRAVSDKSPQTTLRVLQELCGCSENELRNRLTPPGNETLAPLPAAFALDVIQAHCPMPAAESIEFIEIARAASRLHNILTRPEFVYMGNQYFRLNWLPSLGPALALLIVNLRAMCYWNSQTYELRDTCQTTWSTLARQLGCTERQLRNLRQDAQLNRFVTALGDERKAAQMTFRVQMSDPLTDADQARFDRQCTGAPALGIDPETGQLSMRPLLEQPTAKDAEILAHSSAEILALGERKFWHIEGVHAEILAHECGNFGTCIKLLIITPDSKVLTETTLLSDMAATESMLAAALRTHLLDNLGIQEPNKSRLLDRAPRCDHIWAWGLYTLTQSGLSQNKAGYVYNRLIGQDAPPADFLKLAALSPADWRLFYWHKRTDQAHPLVSGEQQTRFEQWSNVLGPVWKELTWHLSPVGADGLRGLLTGTDDRQPSLFDAPEPLAPEPLLDIPTAANSPSCVQAADAEILALGWLEPLQDHVWNVTLAELRWQMPRLAFERWWSDVAPVGVAGDGEGKPARVFLGTSGDEAREWLAAHQTLLVERTLSGVWGRPVQVSFVLGERAVCAPVIT